jgi:hypothetical protein
MLQFKNLIISDELRSFIESLNGEAPIGLASLLTGTVGDDLPVNFVGLSEDNPCYLSYIRADRAQKFNDDNIWEGRLRMKAKPGRVLKAIFPEMSDKDVERATNVIKARGRKLAYEFDVVKGGRITHYYYHENNEAGSGSLNDSCMNGYDQQELVEYYEECDNVRLLILKNTDTDKICGRALVWTTTCGKTVMDRIYGNDDTVELFKEEALSRGWYHRARQSYEEFTKFITPDGDETHLLFKVYTGHTSRSYMPYMDTFFFSYPDEDCLANFPDGYDEDYRLCRSTDGGTILGEYEDWVVCEGNRVAEEGSTFKWDGKRYHNDDGMQVVGYGMVPTTVFYESFVYCEFSRREVLNTCVSLLVYGNTIAKVSTSCIARYCVANNIDTFKHRPYLSDGEWETGSVAQFEANEEEHTLPF